MPSPKQNEERIQRVINAWRDLATTELFGGMTLAQFEAKVQPSFAARKEVAQIENQLSQAINKREDADEVSMDTVQLMVNGVVGNPTYGPDSPLYEALGYTRTSERKTGLTRKKKTPSKG